MLVPAFLSLLVTPVSAWDLATTGDHMVELTDAPYHMADKMEGVYTPWNGRHINGPIYRRTELSYKFQPFVPTFMGAFCGHVFGDAPTDWCIVQCEEGHMMHTGGLLLPCGGAPPDGTVCPATAHDPPPQVNPTDPPPRPAICEVIAHARRYSEAGGDITRFPEPRWWRFLGPMGGWMDAEAMSTGTFAVAPRSMAVPPPGERLRLRRDGTLRSGARPDYCIGAAGGAMQEMAPLIFWDCGQPPNNHEIFTMARRNAHGTFVRLAARPGLCVVVPGGTRELTEGSGAGQMGPPARLGDCGGGPAGVPLLFVEAPDGTIRLASSTGLCLRSGFDRPEAGNQIRLEHCSWPREVPKDLKGPADEPGTLLLAGGEGAEEPADAAAGAAGAGQGGTSEVLAAILALRQGIEAKFDSSIEKLESRMAKVETLHSEMKEWMRTGNLSSSGEAPDADDPPSCAATGGKGPCRLEKFFK